MPDYAGVFREVEADLRRRVEEIVDDRETGRPVVPVLEYADIEAGRVPAQHADLVRRRGACVIRRVFDPAQATEWDNEIAAYVEENRLDEKLAHAAEDKYFGTLQASKPQIYGIYWSRPQVMARQSESLTRARVFLNKLWTSQGHFDPEQVPVYADRIRRRPPASQCLGLSPHTDGGSVERWLDDNFRQVYRHVFAGDWKRYDPFDGAWRPEAREIPSPAVCSMFRTFQGWTALTRQGRGDGTLQLIPIANSMAYVLLRALQDDVAEDDLCGAQPARALSIKPEWHAVLLRALSSIPLMEPGDTVFWHSDVVHAVEDINSGTGYSNVMYIGATPGCPKNSAYLERQAPAFLSGRTPPDFAPDDFEVDFKGRGTEADLTPLGRSQLGLPALSGAQAG
ncbi:MAG TPA: YbiU family protein [Bryobacteraceae bacterium]|nr:YbiU family protein [Bryobacteraceae bacterium]